MNHFTRRRFLKTASLGGAAMGLAPSVSRSEVSSEAETFTVVQICDTQLGMGGYDHDLKTFKSAVAKVNALKPDFVLICGDLVHIPNAKSLANFKTIKAGFTVPCYCVAGNHDVGNTPTPESLQYYRKVIGKDYYSFDHKGYVFVVVNTQLWKAPLKGESEKHDSWLEATLKSAADKHARIVVVGHCPLFLKTPDEPDAYMNLPLAKRQDLLSLFEKRGVVAVLGGHTHKLLLNEHKGIQLVNGETTSKNNDKRPLGFRVWHLTDSRPFKHDFIPVDCS